MEQDIKLQKRCTINKVTEIFTKQIQNKRYQKWLIVFLLVLSFSLSFKKQSIQYFFMNPWFECNYTDKLVRQKSACNHLDLCQIKNQNTLTAKMHLYCGANKLRRNLIQSFRGIGGWVGTFSVGIIADIFGRRVCMIISLIVLNLSFTFLILGAIFNFQQSFMISQILQGIGNKFIFSISLIYMTRFLTKRNCEIVTNAWYLVGGGFTHICLAGANEVIKDWFSITMISSIPLILLLIASIFFIKEDPLFLFEKGDQQGVQKKFNNTPQEEIQQPLRQLKEVHKQHELAQSKTKKATNIKQFCQLISLNKGLFFHTVLLGIIHLASDMTLTGIKYSLQELGFSYNINIIAMGIAEMIGAVTMMKFLEIESNRKRGYIFITTISFLISCFLLFTFISHNKILQSFIVFLLTYMMNITFSFLLRVQVDSLPERYQVSLFSLIQVFSVAHGVVGPFIIQFGVDHKLNNIIFTHGLRFIFGGLLMACISPQRKEVINLHDENQITPIQDNDIVKQKSVYRVVKAE